MTETMGQEGTFPGCEPMAVFQVVRSSCSLSKRRISNNPRFTSGVAISVAPVAIPAWMTTRTLNEEGSHGEHYDRLVKTALCGWRWQSESP